MKKNEKVKNKGNNKLFYKILSFILVVVTVFLFSTIMYLNMLPLNYLISIFVGLTLSGLFLVYKLNHRSLVITKLFLVI